MKKGQKFYRWDTHVAIKADTKTFDTFSDEILYIDVFTLPPPVLISDKEGCCTLNKDSTGTQFPLNCLLYP